MPKKKPKPASAVKKQTAVVVDKIKTNKLAKKLLSAYSKNGLIRFEDLEKLREFNKFLTHSNGLGIQGLECQVIPELFPWDQFESCPTAYSSPVTIARNFAVWETGKDKEYIAFTLKTKDVSFVCKFDLESIGSIGKFLRLSKYKATQKKFLETINIRVQTENQKIKNASDALAMAKAMHQKYNLLLMKASKKKVSK